jgi:alpha-glucosidase
VVDRPNSTTYSSAANASLQFDLVSSPFSFSVKRPGTNETIFDTTGTDLIFESQYLRLRTSLPQNPNLYGFGEDTDAFRLNTTDYTRTLWSRDSYEVPTGTNLYGNHPIYFEHRLNDEKSETHGVFLLNSNGMDLKINYTEGTGQYLEYNTLGGIIDLYFLAGPSPIEVSQQYSQVIGLPAMMPYWGFGFHQCRYGMQDVYEVADVVYNYSMAGIPLETMWTDIDYLSPLNPRRCHDINGQQMDLRKVFTLDSDRFPLEKVRELVTYLHDHDQHYIVMVDPAVAYQDYAPFNNGVDAEAFMRLDNGSIYKGIY